MTIPKAFRTQSELHVVIHARTGVPYTYKIHLRSLLLYVATAGLVMQSFFLGTLLFFRELGLNRRLQERLLELETQDKIGHLLTAPVNSSAPVTKTETSVSITTPAQTTPTPAPAQAADTTAPTTPAADPVVSARITDFAVNCEKTECEARISLMPTSSGTAQGQIIVVMETEVLRIGVAPSGAQTRKRFLVYPSGEARDDFDNNTLGSLKGKSFRFSRALQTTAHFPVGQMLKPLAANVYLLDRNHTLLQHERKTVEADWETQ